MNRSFPVLLSLVVLLGSTVRANDSVIVAFDSQTNHQGLVVAALWDSAETFLSRTEQPVLVFSTRKTSGQLTWRIKNLPPGHYAVSAYHDENSNGELDTNLFGLPVEAYGFSGSTRGSFGPPDFSTAAFTYDGSPLHLRVILED